MLVNQITQAQPSMKQTPKVSSGKPPAPQKKVSLESSPQSGVASFTPRVYDAGFRATMRWVETIALKNTFWRIPFRVVSELTRYSTGGFLGGLIGGNSVDSKKVLFSSTRRALENTVATMAIEPNQFGGEGIKGKAARVMVGFANNVIRVASRILLAAMDFMSPDELNFDEMGDEFFGRSLGRAIYAESDNPVVGIGVRALEQLGINEILHQTPLKKFIGKRLINGNDKKPREPSLSFAD